jgi:signal transduction histidine kinase
VATKVDAARTANPDAEILVESETGVEVVADADRIAQVMDNLIGNALRYGAPPVRIAVSTTSQVAAVRVSDSGRGVDPALQPHLFERFATGNTSGGTGLGLFIVRELARAHGGDAFYEPSSEERPDGTFVFSLPLG